MPERPKTSVPKPEAASLGVEELRKLLIEYVQADPRTGTFRVFDRRLLILRPEMLVDLQKQLEQTVGLSSKGFLYLAGEKSAKEGHNLVRFLGDRDPAQLNEADRLLRMVDTITLSGWGRFELTKADAEARRYVLTLENSPIAETYGPAKKPVCHLLAGWLAGLAQDVLGQGLLCEEVTCRSQGKPRCEFELRPMPYV